MLCSAEFYALLILCAIYFSSAIEKGSWTWIAGSNTRNQKPTLNGSQVYPGSRDGATSWRDRNGTVWIYGGKGYGIKRSSSMRQLPTLDELWSFDIDRRNWSVFVSQNGSANKPPPCYGCVSCSYGNQAVLFGMTSLTWIFNMVEKTWTSYNLTKSPIPRKQAAYWCNTENGTLWMFGGVASDEKLNDFWQFSFEEMQWREIRPKTNTSVIPAKRNSASTWIHPSGLLYMFGGSAPSGLIADFWVFSPATSVWTKLAGTRKCAGHYGERGLPSKNNFPGCREAGATWVDEQGDLRLFGGSGYDNYSNTAFSTPGLLSDFWMFNTSVWVWTGGLSRGEGVPFYGDKGKIDLRNLPGPRDGAVSFRNGSQLWLFGGVGHDHKGYDGILNDMWVYNAVPEEVHNPATPTPQSKPPTLQGDTVKISFGIRVVIAFTVMALGLVVTLAVCYTKECRIFRFRRRLGTVIKYKPVKVEMMQVQQPEIPLAPEPNRHL